MVDSPSRNFPTPVALLNKMLR